MSNRGFVSNWNALNNWIEDKIDETCFFLNVGGGIDQFLDHLISYNNIITFCLEDQNTLSWSLCSSIDYQRLSYFAMTKIEFPNKLLSNLDKMWKPASKF